MKDATVHASHLDAAIDWMVQLCSGESTPADTARHRAWHDADPRHASAWAQVSGAVRHSVEPLRRVQGEQAAQAGKAGLNGSGAALQTALLRPTRRRALRAALGLAAVGVTTGWLLNRQWPVTALLAQHRTGTGERRELTLADGSRLLLNARSSVDIEFGATSRTVRLRAGEIIATAMPDAARPFVIRTAEGSVQALGTRFLVRQEEGQTVAAVLAHSVRIQTTSSREATLQEGESARFTADDIVPLQTAPAGLAGWERGMLAVHDQPLGEVIAALRPYREGFIRVSPAAARLRVLGAFALDDPERVLESLAQTLPIHLSRYGGWLVTIDTASC